MATPTVTLVRDADGYVDYTPGSAVTAGDVVVQSKLLGVATADISANAKGALAIRGVFRFPKNTGSGNSFAAGAKVYWNTSSDKATSTNTDAYAGLAIAAASTSASTVDVLLAQEGEDT